MTTKTVKVSLLQFAKLLPANVVLTLWSVLIALPLYVLTVSCFKTTSEIYANPLGLPTSWGIANFVSSWSTAHFDRYTLNSLIVSVGSISLTLITGVLASYPLSRLHRWWTLPLTGYFLAGIMIPVRLGSVELFLLMKQLHLLDSYLGLILAYTAIRIPFAIYVISGFMRTVPVEFEDAARIDGAGHFRILWNVMVPQSRGAIAIVAVFTAIAVWNDFYFPLLFIFNDSLKTLPAIVATFTGQYRTDWGPLFAGMTISIIPMVALYAAMSRHIRAGVAAGGFR